MTQNSSLEEQIALYRDDAEFKAEVVLLDLNEQIVSWMQRQGLKRSELAERLGVSRAYVTQLLAGNPNLTVKTLCRIAIALGVEVNVQLALPDLAQNRLVSFKPVDLPSVLKNRSVEGNESALAA